MTRSEAMKKPRNTGSTSPVAVERRAAGVTQRQLADALGVHIDTLRRWEGGKVPLPPYALPGVLEAIRSISGKTEV